jgi:hypothetical protein
MEAPDVNTMTTSASSAVTLGPQINPRRVGNSGGAMLTQASHNPFIRFTLTAWGQS